MKFAVTHMRAFVGTDISVTVTTAEKESIAEVTVVYDGDTLEEMELASGTESYTRNFSGTGASSPGAEHMLAVTATDGDGQAHSATTRWNDV